MRRRIVAGNWKMNKTLDEAFALIQDLIENLDESILGETDVIVAPPSVVLPDVVEQLWESDFVSVAAQNCHHEESGAYTGEISAQMIASLEADAVIVGHSERRQYFGETDALIAKKIDRLFDEDLVPIYCCGETLEQRQSGSHFDVVKTQISEALGHLSADQMQEVVIAYEPVWAIGTGEIATSEQAQEMHAFIRSHVTEMFDAATAEEVSILYGGSCKPSNAKELFANPDVDGGLIGGASLNAHDFIAIIDAMKVKG